MVVVLIAIVLHVGREVGAIAGLMHILPVLREEVLLGILVVLPRVHLLGEVGRRVQPCHIADALLAVLWLLLVGIILIMWVSVVGVLLVVVEVVVVGVVVVVVVEVGGVVVCPVGVLYVRLHVVVRLFVGLRVFVVVAHGGDCAGWSAAVKFSFLIETATNMLPTYLSTIIDNHPLI